MGAKLGGMPLAGILKHNDSVGSETRIIHFGRRQIAAPVADIKLALQMLTASPNQQRMVALARAHLARDFRKVKNKTASPELASQCMQNIALLFANEILAGRQTLEMN